MGKRLGDLERNASKGATDIQASHQVAANVWSQFDDVFEGINVRPELIRQFERGAKRAAGRC